MILLIVLLASSLPLSLAQDLGQWGGLIQFPVIPVAAYIVPEYPRARRMLVFSAFGNDTFSGPRGVTQFADYNFQNGTVSHRQVAETNHDMFCPGMSSLPDGRLVISGGSDAQVTSIYNPANNAFTRGPDMKIPRGYQTSATLSNGKVFTIGGSYSGPRGGKNGEIYDPATNQWTLLPNAAVAPMLTTDREGDWRTDNHAWLFGWSNGSVFQAGPSQKMNWYGTSGSGSVQAAGVRDSIDEAMCGVNVMYDIGQIFSAGGNTDYTESPANKRAHTISITTPGRTPTVRRLPDMANARGFANAVVLPDGTVLVTGGQRFARVFTDTDAVLTPELFNPATRTFKQLAPEAKPRNYHSVSILLPDARVFSGGGGLCYVPDNADVHDHRCDRSVDHLDGQIFSPPYLFRNGQPATRPAIANVTTPTSTGGTSVKVGSSLSVTMEGTGSASAMRFALIRIGSVTHSINSDQRRIPLQISQASGPRATLRLPTDPGVLIPGPYYLFALASGVPSVAWTVLVQQ